MSNVLSAKQIGKRLKAFRKQSGIRTSDLEEQLEVSRQHIYHLENGERGLSVKWLQKFAKTYGVTPEAILGKTRKTA